MAPGEAVAQLVEQGLRRLPRRGVPRPRGAAEGFSTDALAWATSAELIELQNRVTQTIDEWRESIDREDGQERMPVFFFAHGFPTEV